MHAKVKYTELQLARFWIYVAKTTSFCQVLKEKQTKENWFLFSASMRRLVDTAKHKLIDKR